MFNVKSSKLLMVAATVATLAGCQSSGIDYAAIRQASNTTDTPQGRALGGGFVSGMTPEQTCIYFYDNYKTKRNKLCKSIGNIDFSALTVVNKNITKSPDRKNPMTTIAFSFDDNAKLMLVQAVANDGADDGNNKNKTSRQISSNY